MHHDTTFVLGPNETGILEQMQKTPFVQVINSEKHKVRKDPVWFSTPPLFLLEAEVTDIMPGKK